MLGVVAWYKNTLQHILGCFASQKRQTHTHMHTCTHACKHMQAQDTQAHNTGAWVSAAYDQHWRWGDLKACPVGEHWQRPRTRE
jgi:hypothetical protein